MSFQRRILLMMSLLTLIPVLIFYSTSFSQFSHRLSQEIENEVQLAAVSVNHEVEDLLHPGIAGLKLLSELSFLHEQLLEEWDKDSGIRNLLLQFQRAYPHYQELRVLKGGGKPLWFSSTWHLRVTLQPSEKTLSRLAQTAGSYLESIQQSTQSPEIPELTVGVVFEGETGNNHLIEASIDIRAFFSRIDTIVGGWKRGSYLRALMILDANHQVIYRTQAAPSNWNPEDKLYVNRYQDLASLPGYHLVFLVLKDDLEQPEKRLKQQVVSVAILLALITSICGYWLVKRLTRPIRKLVQAAKLVATGNLQPDLDLGKGDEFSELARGFEFMCHSLQSRQDQLEELRSKLQRSVDDLERQVMKRTAELFERYEEQKQLSRMLTHDLGNMIGSVQLGLTSLKGSDHSLQEIESLVVVAKETAVFLRRFRELMALEEGRIEARVEWVDVADMIADLEILYANRLADKGLKLEVVLQPDLRLYVDREWFLLSVLSNLMSNAIKFSHPGSAIFWSAISEGSETVLKLSDQGIGMSEEECERAVQAGKNKVRLGTQGERGTGFGLPMVVRWVQFFHGTLKFSPNAESGLEVCMRFPGRANS